MKISLKNLLVTAVIIITAFAAGYLNSLFYEETSFLKYGSHLEGDAAVNKDDEANAAVKEWTAEVSYRIFRGITIKNLTEVQKCLETGTATLIDVRSRESFAEGSIPGAVNVPVVNRNPYKFIEEVKNKLTTDEVILFCDGIGCDESINAANLLKSMSDIKNISVFPGGYNQWL